MAKAICDRTVTMDWPGFSPRPVHVGFVIDYVTLGQNFPRVVRFSPVTISLPLLQGSSFIYHRHCTIVAIQSVAK
jgi:hypothetical protein